MSSQDEFLSLTTVQEVDEESMYPTGEDARPCHDPGLDSLSCRPPIGDTDIFPESNRKRVSFSALTSRPVPQNQSKTHLTLHDAVNNPPIQPRTVKQKKTSFLSKFSFRSTGSLDDNILKQSALRRSSVRTTVATPRQFLGVRGVSTTLVFAKRNSPAKHSPAAAHAAAVVQEQDKARATYRRYRVGDSVLVCNTPSRMTNLVNRYGYPAEGGVTPEEQRGPYIYVLATVKKVHFEEDAEYYTVTRADTGMDQRADAEWMEPLRTARGEAAALRAATESQAMNQNDRGLTPPVGPSQHHRSEKKFVEIVEAILCIPLAPIMWLGGWFVNVVGMKLYQLGQKGFVTTRNQGKLFLNGMKPYSFSLRLTVVNLLVLCSSWYMFIDQARLAFFPPHTDNALAIVSLIVWVILVLELLFEVFIRPDGYISLIASEKAYSPSTVRFINSFHLVVESLSLALFIPEFLCLWTASYTCGDRPAFSYFNAAYMAILGSTQTKAFYGRAYFALVRLRVFGLVRHWKKMWINNTFVSMRWKGHSGGLLSGVFVPNGSNHGPKVAPHDTSKKHDKSFHQPAKGNSLINASNIGTALMVKNSHRALTILCAIMGLFPLISTLNTHGGTNRVSAEMTKQLQSINTQFTNSTSADECHFMMDSVFSWVVGVVGSGNRQASTGDGEIYLLHLAIEPVRCQEFYPLYDGNVTSSFCRMLNSTLSNVSDVTLAGAEELCAVWVSADNASIFQLAELGGVRTGAIKVEDSSEPGVLTSAAGSSNTTFSVTAKFNQTYSIRPAALSSFLLQVCLLISVLGGLSVLRRDSGVLVLGPLRRMLKIVAQYAKNPLSTVKTGKDDDSDEDSDDGVNPEDKLGNYETEQLISAVSKITDLLRKCWGVAGADIISTNLATQEGALTEVFNPTVPGKSVYALFGFAAINDFDHTLRQLGGEVMILINDVAAVLHGEVFRWGFGDSGQCNKNLGAAFLMVFRIGLVKEVIQKLEQATDVVFSNTTSKKSGVRRRNKNATQIGVTSASKVTMSRTVNDKRRKSQRAVNSSRAAMSLSLQSLPGISTFTDRAVIGMLKSFAGIYRDNKLLGWKNDFRLGAGVGAFSVNMIFGMDAGWAVEGAVGSEYKIDATYLSPHVNMASRMMSACKQYGVSILLSQAVQELMSDTARSKLRHLDTVTVKGSSLKQKIFTYDARHKGVDFFLFSRSDEQADVDSDRYTPNVWSIDQDLTAMRQHVTEDFEKEFNKGRDAYLAGDWPKAMKHLTSANEIMVETVMDQGYIQDELNELQNRILDGEDVRAAEEELRTETGDGPSRRLITFMESEGKKAPETWKGYRPLTSK